MSDKPTVLPAWATTGTATEPSAGSKLIGFIPGAKWAAQHANWLLLNIYLWLLWISNGVLQRSAAADNSPVWSSADRDGNQRHYVDPNGYFGGPAIQELHRWGPVSTGVNITTGNPCSRLGATVFADTNCTVQVLSGTSAAVEGGGPQLTLNVATGASGDRALVVSEYGGGTPSSDQPITDLDDNIVVMEWSAYISSTTLTGMEYASGLHNFAAHSHAGLGAGTNRFVQFYAAAGNANWLCRCAKGGAITSDDSGVAVTTGFKRFRLELHGANTALGASVARFFIDGALVSEMSSDDSDQVPSGGSALGMMHWAGGTSPASNRAYSITSCLLAWTESRLTDVPV